VEASETSGTLIQAKAAIQQGRKLFILNSCFERGLDWPEKLLAKGAIRVRDVDDVITALEE
jgi:DNA processing protein